MLYSTNWQHTMHLNKILIRQTFLNTMNILYNHGDARGTKLQL